MVKTRVSVSQRVKKIAKVLQLFTPEELAQLVDLVPQLQEVEPIRDVEESAAEYFRRELLARRGGKPPAPDEPFIGGLTYGEYLALSEEEEAAFWDKLFTEEAMEIDDFEEHDVRADARVPARQERGTQDRHGDGQGPGGQEADSGRG
jgi:hypothetical protein